MKTSVIACVTSVTPRMVSVGTAHAQRLGDSAHPKSLKQKSAQTFDVPSTNCEAMSRALELGRNARSGCQGQPGPEGVYMLDFSGISPVDGQSALQLQEGESHKLAPGVVHGDKAALMV